jgi:hypothetical protein
MDSLAISNVDPVDQAQAGLGDPEPVLDRYIADTSAQEFP